MTELVPLTNVPLPVRLRVEDYLLLDEAGAFADYGKTELIEGEVVYMNSQHRPHARTKSRLYRLIATCLDALPGGLEAIVEAAFTIPPHNVPEPDIVITNEADGTGLVPLSSVRIVIEVADTTLRSDLRLKANIYALADVPEYWVVDVNGRCIHQFWLPDGKCYTEKRIVAFGNDITAATIDQLTISTIPL